MSEFIEVVSPKALKDTKELNDEIVKMISNVKTVNDNMVKFKTPSGSDSAIKDLNDKLIKQEQLYARLQTQLERYATAQNRTKISANQLEQSEIRLAAAKDRQVKALEREQAKLEAASSLYQKVQTRLNELQKEYRDLATIKELGGKLTDSETKRYNQLDAQIKKYDTTLKAVDASMGKYQRNVGNYASGFSPINNSINQLTREMPAFANSVQTGFMAISNNLPIFFDAMQQAIAQQKELQAQGKPSKNALQIIAGGLFTVGTALSVGITLLTLFGPKLIDSIMRTKEKAKAIEEEKKAIEAKAEAENKANESLARYESEEVSRARILFENAKNLSLSYKERLKAVNELKTRYPDYLGHLSNEKILAGDTAKEEERLNLALINRGKAIASQQLLADNALAQMKAQVEYEKITAKNFEAINKLRNQDGSIKNLEKYNQTLYKSNKTNTEAKKILDDKLKPLKEEEAVLLGVYNENAKYIGIVHESTSATEESNKSKLEAIQLTKGQSAQTNALISSIEQQIQYFESLRDSAALNIAQYRDFDKVVQNLKFSLDLIKDPTKFIKDSSKELQAQQELLKKHAEGWAQIQKAMENYSQSFVDSFVNGSGFKTTFDILNGNILGFGSNAKVTALAITESFQEMFNFISQASQANFDAEYDRLSKKKEIDIKFAGDSDAAKEEIEKQYQERQRALRRREAESKKQEAIMNIAIDTAQAVMATLGKTGIFGIPLTAILLALGAAQIALVSSQQIPNYEQGTDNHLGGFMRINDQKGSNFEELVETPDGKKRIYKGRNVIIDAPRGTKVKTAAETRALLAFDSGLNNILQGNGITYIETNKGAMTDEQVSRIENALKNVPTSQVNFDELGYTKYQNRNGQRQRILNAHLRGQITSR